MAENSNLTIEQRLNQLQKAKERAQSFSVPKIQRVAHHLRDRKHFTKHYLPRLISLGPIHYGSPKLHLGEHYKQMWASTYISTTGQTSQTLHNKVTSNIKNLKDLFDTDLFSSNNHFCNYHNQGFKNMEEMICWTLFVDGCALLHILEHAKLDPPYKLNVKVDQLVLVMQDVLLLENQLPYALLKLLWRNNDEKLVKTMKEFLKCHHWATKEEHNVKIEISSPIHHLIHLQRTIILYEPRPKEANQNDDAKQKTNQMVPPPKEANLQIQNDEEANLQIQNDEEANLQIQNDDAKQKTDQMVPRPKEANLQIQNDDAKQKTDQMVPNPKEANQNDDAKQMVTYRNIKELKAAGIGLKTSNTRRPRDISFSYGWLCSELTLPEIVVDDTTAYTVLNLIAYEMCPDFENDYGISSYVSFLDSLIDHPDDVKALRSERILLNSLGSDDEVAKLFNIIGTDSVPDMGKYECLRKQIERHYNNKCKTWLALGYHTYFNNPWAIIAFNAAVLGLTLTFIQTWYAIHPSSNN